MAILAMKRLNIIALSADRDELLKGLMKLGCVEISQPDIPEIESDANFRLATDESAGQQVSSNLQEIQNALSIIDRYSPISRGLFSAPREITVERFFDRGRIDSALEIARNISALVHDISSYEAELSRLAVRRASLAPWRSMDVPLDQASTQNLSVMFGVCPGTVSVEELEEAASSASDAFKLERVRSDNEQHYLLLLCYAEDTDEVLSNIKRLGFTTVSFKEYSGTAEENIRRMEAREEELKGLIEACKSQIVAFKKDAELLEDAADSLSAELVRENARNNILKTEYTILITSWVPEREMKRVEKLLQKFGCAYEFRDPADGESPPVILHNSRFFYPFNMVTNMYSLPEYGSLDPNPLFGLFFALFFGIMFADIGYGLLLVLVSIFATRMLYLRKGSMTEQMVMLAGICGVAAIFWGIMFGSFFGDAVSVFSENFLGTRYVLPPLAFNPLEGNGPLILLVVCLGMGAVHILFGMGIKAYMLIRDGKPWDALMDVGSWWLLFAGIALAVLGKGWYVALAGALALVLTQGRASKGIFGKLLKGLSSLYDITAYFSDVLSYSRLMALCMAGAVIASVFNILGGMTGPVFFWVVFIIGHLFNMGINIIGTYVHSARLQYLEFFGKWYREGGKPFEPLSVLTKYVNVKNEQEEISI